ncbi:MAG: thioesterase family protein [Acidimicrobiales bacterium]
MTRTEASQALRDAAAVEPIAPRRWRVELSPIYTVMGRPNGGYLQCVLSNAALAASTQSGAHHLHVTSITTNFVHAADLGPAQIDVEIRRVGRGVSFAHVVLSQDDAVKTEALVTLGILGEDSDVRYSQASPFSVAPLDESAQLPAGSGATYMAMLDLRFDPSCVGWWFGEKSTSAEVKGWIRLNDGQATWDAWNVLFACDAMPPATMPIGSSGWVPTLQLTSYVRRIPRSEWLRVRQWCVVIADGTVDERCELFDSRGELVACSSQIAMVRFPSVE